MKQSPKQVYTGLSSNYKNELSILQIKRSRLGWLRLFIILVTLLFVYRLFFGLSLINWLIVAAGIIAFITAVTIDLANNQKIERLEKLVSINKDELNILNGNHGDREDGTSFAPIDHPYAADLDLFGKNSLYQYINRCHSYQAKELLASGLLGKIDSTLIIERQQAAIELSNETTWRQELQYLSSGNPLTNDTERKILAWLQSPTPFMHPSWKTFLHLYTTITVATLVACIAGYIAVAAFALIVFTYYVISLLVSRKIISSYIQLSKIVSEVDTLQKVFAHFEPLQCNALLLVQLQQGLQTNGNASNNILELKRILDRFDYRYNQFVFIILNSFLLWDLKQVISLNKWKQTNGETINTWFTTIANIEIINTLATLAFNHPAWVNPILTENYFTLTVSQLGHPLIDATKRVDNSFSTGGTSQVSIVTGSNMAGKSTFLRSVGVNLVLAQMGGVVCAKSFVFSPAKLYTSMRIADNLAENTSTFYAELKKLKAIIEQVNNHEKIFILLDEILRGTNSLDRHTGSVALVKQLVREDAVAIIATHDVELAALQQELQHAIHNYHFDVQVEGEELYFDYKLKRGICQSLNASLLMKKIGIEL